MCGIAGIVSSEPLAPDAVARATRMRDVLRHRGPDASGLHQEPRAVLAHQRLSIVDLDAGGQPLANEDGTVWVTFNGEIYNHAEIRHDLEARGHVYRTHSDTESIVHAYEQWGDACVDRFRGMFAFAIWDGPRQRLLLARDRLGVKPLYWARAGDVLLFGSEIKAILASGLLTADPNLGVLSEMLGTRYTSDDQTLFAGVRKLLPGHCLVFARGRSTTRSYWDVPVARPGAPIAPGEAVERFTALLNESVRLRLMSDVPLGMFLSGGIDSSAIAAVMARLVGRRIKTFSVAFKDRACNELDYARQVAHAIGAEPHDIVIDDRDFFGALPRLLWHEDEPIAHPSSVPLYFVSALARRHVTVVLTGEGSDELLAGYGKYPRTAWNWRAGRSYGRLLPQRVRAAIARRVSAGRGGRASRALARSFLAVDRTPAAMVFDNFAAIPLAEQRALLSPDLRAMATSAHAYAAPVAAFERPGPSATLLDRLLYADMKTYLVELLMKQDQMSMAASIESRVPFLDHVLVEFAASLPDAWKLSGWTTKRVLREAMKPLLPRAILKRPKLGFPVPFGTWTRDSWNAVVADVLRDRRTRERGLFDDQAVARLLADHAAGRSAHGDAIWSLLNLELWFRTFIDKQGVQTLPTPASPRSHASAVVEVGPAAAAR